MKRILIVLLITLVYKGTIKGQALSQPIQFNKQFYDLENHWVAFPKNEQTEKYPFGYIYIDAMAGFTFNLEGSFTVDNKGKLFRDSSDYIKNKMVKYRLPRNTKLVYEIPDNLLKTLGVKQTPDWAAIYKTDINTAAGKVSWGKQYNSAGDISKALEYLESAYKIDPHAAGLEFELTYSYNELKEYDKAITILDNAIKNKPDNEMLYRELGYSYAHKPDYPNAIKAYLKGIEIAGQRNPEARAEMAWNLATIYREEKIDTEFKKWGQYAKNCAPANTGIAKMLANLTF